MSHTPIVFFGTRPELIKMAPVVEQLRRDNRAHQVVWVQQHTDLVWPLLDYFQIQPDLQIPVYGETLSEKAAVILTGLAESGLHGNISPTVQGDTLTAYSTALWGFYQRLPVVHVEAGLRSHNLMHPWPEEMQRRAITLCAFHHCAPTREAYHRLVHEEKCSNVVWTGNPVVDAVRGILESEEGPVDGFEDTVLVTGHRRENLFGAIFAVCASLADFLHRCPGANVTWVLHKNEAVRGNVLASFLDATADTPDVRNRWRFIEPQLYPQFVRMMQAARLIVTDSGGIQEEASVIQTPVVVTRQVTERPEAVQAGYVQYVGCGRPTLAQTIYELYHNPPMAASGRNPFEGPGESPAAEIADLLAVL